MKKIIALLLALVLVSIPVLAEGSGSLAAYEMNPIISFEKQEAVLGTSGYAFYVPSDWQEEEASEGEYCVFSSDRGVLTVYPMESTMDALLTDLRAQQSEGVLGELTAAYLNKMYYVLTSTTDWMIMDAYLYVDGDNLIVFSFALADENAYSNTLLHFEILGSVHLAV